MNENTEILILGDVMLDHYIYGEVTRISPEAPIPVVLKNKDEYILGGAANVAANLINLDVKVQLIGAIGEDSDGEHFERLLEQKGITSFLLKDDHIKTTCKTRVIAQNHQMLRIDSEERLDLLDEHFDKIKEKVKAFNGRIIILSDYNKGLCNHEVCQWVIQYANSQNIKVLVDPKENDWEKFKGAYLIKPNSHELNKILQKRAINTNYPYDDQLNLLINELDIDYLLITLGGDGMRLVSRKEIMDIPPHKVDVYDVTGAGDTVISVLSYGLIKNKTIKEASLMANEAAAYVITKNNTYAIKKNDINIL